MKETGLVKVNHHMIKFKAGIANLGRKKILKGNGYISILWEQYYILLYNSVF